MTDTRADILRKAKAHISDPAMWYKGAYSEDGLIGAWQGKPCCMSGAIHWAYDGISSWKSLVDLASECVPKNGLGIQNLAAFNDDIMTRHCDVMTMFDYIIEKAEREG